MLKHFLTEDEAESYARDNTAAGYVDPFIILIDDDMEVLKKGEALLFCGEYGVLITWETDAENETL
jgi:hypothetical protein